MGGTSMNGASGGAGSARVRHACAGVVGMGGVGGCELVLAHCWVLEQQVPWPVRVGVVVSGVRIL